MSLKVIRPYQGFFPFVLFRASEMSSGWHCKEVNGVVHSHSCSTYIQEVVEILVQENICPFYVMHVQHCQNCESHSSTTRHVPGSFERVFDDISSQLAFHLPPMVMRSNDVATFENLKTLPPPPIGCFEVVVRPYLNKESMLIHSKLKSKCFPLASDLIRQLSNLMLPEDLLFSNQATAPILEMIVFDSYYQKPVANAEITVYRVTINTAKKYSKEPHRLEYNQIQNSKSSETLKHPHDPKSIKSPTKSSGNGIKHGSPSKPGLNSLNSTDVTLPPMASRRNRLTSISFQHSKLLSSQSFEDALLRHSTAYYRVRTWAKEDIVKWLEYYTVNSNVIKQAVQDGVVDGPSFLKLVTPKNLQKWGVRGRGTINHIMDGINSLKLGDQLLEAKDQSQTSNIPFHWDGLPALMSPSWSNVAANEFKDSVKFSSPSNVTEKGDTSKRNQTGSNGATDNPHESQIRYQYLHLERVAKGSTSRTGIFRCHSKLKQSGAYIFTVKAPTLETYSSQVFNVNSPCRLGYALRLKPVLVRILFIVKGTNNGVQSHIDHIKRSIRYGHEDTDYHTIVTNMHTGEKLCVSMKKIYLPSEDDTVNDTQPKVRSQNYASPKYLFQPQYMQNTSKPASHRGSLQSITKPSPQNIPEKGNKSSRKSKDNFFDDMDDTVGASSHNSSTYVSPKSVNDTNNKQRNLSLSALVQNSPNLARIFWKDGQSPSNVSQGQIDNRQYFYIGEIWLPCGSYYCDIDGCTFNVKSPAQDSPYVTSFMTSNQSIYTDIPVEEYFASTPFTSKMSSRVDISSDKTEKQSETTSLFIPLQNDETNKPGILRNDSMLASNVLNYLQSVPQPVTKSHEMQLLDMMDGDNSHQGKSHSSSVDKTANQGSSVYKKDKSTPSIHKFIIFREKYLVKARQKRVLAAINTIENWYFMILNAKMKRKQNQIDGVATETITPRNDLSFTMRSGIQGFMQGFRIRRVIRVQTFYRCYYWRRRYRILKHLVLSLQTLWRRYMAKVQRKHLISIVEKEARRKLEELELKRIAAEMEKAAIEKAEREERERIAREEEERRLRVIALAASSKYKEPSPWDNFLSYLEEDNSPKNSVLEDSPMTPSTKNRNPSVSTTMTTTTIKSQEIAARSNHSLESLTSRIKSKETTEMFSEYWRNQDAMKSEEKSVSIRNISTQSPSSVASGVSRRLGGNTGPAKKKNMFHDEEDDRANHNLPENAPVDSVLPSKSSEPVASETTVGEPIESNQVKNDSEENSSRHAITSQILSISPLNEAVKAIEGHKPSNAHSRPSSDEIDSDNGITKAGTNDPQSLDTIETTPTKSTKEITTVPTPAQDNIVLDPKQSPSHSSSERDLSLVSSSQSTTPSLRLTSSNDIGPSQTPISMQVIPIPANSLVDNPMKQEESPIPERDVKIRSPINESPVPANPTAIATANSPQTSATGSRGSFPAVSSVKSSEEVKPIRSSFTSRSSAIFSSASHLLTDISDKIWSKSLLPSEATEQAASDRPATTTRGSVSERIVKKDSDQDTLLRPSSDAALTTNLGSIRNTKRDLLNFSRQKQEVYEQHNSPQLPAPSDDHGSKNIDAESSLKEPFSKERAAIRIQSIARGMASRRHFKANMTAKSDVSPSKQSMKPNVSVEITENDDKLPINAFNNILLSPLTVASSPASYEYSTDETPLRSFDRDMIDGEEDDIDSRTKTTASYSSRTGQTTSYFSGSYSSSSGSTIPSHWERTERNVITPSNKEKPLTSVLSVRQPNDVKMKAGSFKSVTFALDDEKDQNIPQTNAFDQNDDVDEEGSDVIDTDYLHDVLFDAKSRNETSPSKDDLSHSMESPVSHQTGNGTIKRPKTASPRRSTLNFSSSDSDNDELSFRIFDKARKPNSNPSSHKESNQSKKSLADNLSISSNATPSRPAADNRRKVGQLHRLYDSSSDDDD